MQAIESEIAFCALKLIATRNYPKNVEKTQNSSANTIYMRISNNVNRKFGLNSSSLALLYAI